VIGDLAVKALADGERRAHGGEQQGDGHAVDPLAAVEHCQMGEARIRDGADHSRRGEHPQSLRPIQPGTALRGGGVVFRRFAAQRRKALLRRIAAQQREDENGQQGHEAGLREERGAEGDTADQKRQQGRRQNRGRAGPGGADAQRQRLAAAEPPADQQGDRNHASEPVGCARHRGGKAAAGKAPGDPKEEKRRRGAQHGQYGAGPEGETPIVPRHPQHGGQREQIPHRDDRGGLRIGQPQIGDQIGLIDGERAGHQPDGAKQQKRAADADQPCPVNGFHGSHLLFSLSGYAQK